MQYIVPMCRTSFAFYEIEVTANSIEEAAKIALETAGNFEYSEKDANYEINGSIEEINPIVASPFKKAILEYGNRIVREAEAYYETDFGKSFWNDLNEQERNEYLAKAKLNYSKSGVTNE